MDKDYRLLPFDDMELALIQEGLMTENYRLPKGFEHGELNERRSKIRQDLIMVIGVEFKERKEREKVKMEAERKAREIRCGCCNSITGYKHE